MTLVCKFTWQRYKLRVSSQCNAYNNLNHRSIHEKNNSIKKEKVFLPSYLFHWKDFPFGSRYILQVSPHWVAKDYGPLWSIFSPNLVVISSKRYQARPRFLLQLYQLERGISFLYCLVSKGRLWTDTIPLICINVHFSLPFPLNLMFPMSLVLNLVFCLRKCCDKAKVWIPKPYWKLKKS